MNGFFGKFISIILVIMNLCSFIPVSAAENVVVHSHASFEEYITNDLQDYFEVSGLSDVVVTEVGDNNKAVMINKKSMYDSQLKKSFDVIEGNVVFQFDIKIEGEVFPWNFSLTANNDAVFNVLNVDESGNLLTAEGKQYGTIGGDKWINVAIIYHPITKRYSVCIDRSAKLKNWLLNDKSFNSLAGVSFSMTPTDKGDSKIYIDNFKIYSGTKLLKDSQFVKKEYNKNLIEYVEKETSMSDEISMSDNFDNSVVKKYPNGNKVEIREEDGNKFLHLEETKTAACYADYTDGMGLGIKYNVIYSVDIRSTQYSGAVQLFQFNIKPDSTDCKTVYISGGNLYLYNGDKIATLDRNVWQNITMSVNFLSRKYSVYLDGNKIAEDIPLMAKNGTLPSLIRFYCAGGKGNNIDIDNVLIYYGSEPRTILDKNTISGYPLDLTLHYWEVDKIPEELLKGKLAYNGITSNVFFNNKKIIGEENGAFINNKIIYIPVEKTANRLGKQITLEDDGVKYENISVKVNSSNLVSNKKNFNLSAPVIEKNGIIYAPADAFGEEKLFGEKVFYNDRGVIVFGVSELSEDKEAQIVKFMQFERPSKEKILADYQASGIQNVHPRILLNQKDFDNIKSNIETDEKAKELYEKVRGIYTNVEKMPIMTYNIADGTRLLPVCEEIYLRVLTMSFVYKLSGDEVYAERAYKELEAASKFPSWNPTHYLDVARMSQAFAVGYDWLYDYLTEERRILLEEAMIKFSMKEYLRRYTTKESWSYSDSNWAAICNGGGIMLAMALMDKYPEESSAMLEIAIKGFENCLYGFGPDGAWFEGPGYWSSTIDGIENGLQTLKTTINKDYGMASSAGFSETADWAASIAYSNIAFGFADAASTTGLTIEHRDSMWMGNYYENPKLQNCRLDALDRGFTGGSNLYAVYDAMYYKPEYRDAVGESLNDLDFYYREVEMVSTRASWKDDAMFLAYKGGSARQEGHNHMDSGTFSLFQDGICWANDYGYDNYNSAGYYQYKEGIYPNRWGFYRTNTQGHNCIVIDPDDNRNPQNWQAMSKVVRFEDKPKGSIGAIDLSDAYADKAKKYIRGYMLSDDRRSTTIRDEISLHSGTREIYWFMHTGISGDENFEINGNSMVITHTSGEKLYLEFKTNASEYEIYTMNSEFLPSFENKAKDLWAVEGKKVVIKLKGKGNIHLTTKMYDNDLVGMLTPIDERTIDEWTIPDGECKEAPSLEGLYQNDELIENFNENVIEYKLLVPFDKEYPIITAKTTENAQVEKTVNEDGSECRIRVISNEDAGLFSNYVVKMTKVPYIYKTFDEHTIIKPKEITASRTPEAANPPKNVNDGNFSTRFAVDGDNEWIQLDYGTVVEADAFAVAYYKGLDRTSYYDILISEDGENYKTIFSGATSGLTEYYELYTTGKIKLRYLKLVGHENSEGSWNSPTEIALLVKKGE